MQCGVCEGRTRVVRTRRLDGEATERIRVCDGCGRVLRTMERPVPGPGRADRSAHHDSNRGRTD